MYARFNMNHAYCGEAHALWTCLVAHFFRVLTPLLSLAYHYSFYSRFVSLNSINILTSAYQINGQVLGTAFNSAFTKPLQLQQLTELRFGDMFNHPIINSQKVSLLPANLKKLSFGRHFNQSLPDGALPSRLQEIELGGDFTQAFSACKFPSTLTLLRFGEHFDMDIPASEFPSHLKQIELHQNFNSHRQKPHSNNWLTVTTWI